MRNPGWILEPGKKRKIGEITGQLGRGSVGRLTAMRQQRHPGFRGCVGLREPSTAGSAVEGGTGSHLYCCCKFVLRKSHKGDWIKCLHRPRLARGIVSQTRRGVCTHTQGYRGNPLPFINSWTRPACGQEHMARTCLCSEALSRSLLRVTVLCPAHNFLLFLLQPGGSSRARETPSAPKCHCPRLPCPSRSCPFMLLGDHTKALVSSRKPSMPSLHRLTSCPNAGSPWTSPRTAAVEAPSPLT